MSTSSIKLRCLLLLVAICGSWVSSALAGVLPEDRADALYHRYEGGGVTVQGPSLLVRKKMGDKFSVSANYYVDTVSSASIDVVTNASPYKEERTQWSTGVDYLRGKTTYSVDYTSSEESDYIAQTASFGLSQDMFGALTTVSLGYSRGWDEVKKNGAPDFSARTDRRNYRLGISQIVTKQLILGLNYEAVTDQGYLHNPYRQVRYSDPTNSGSVCQCSLQDERYPGTRTSNAVSLDARYFLPYRAALHGNYRFFTDTWGINANTFELGYIHPTKGPWTFETSYRFYSQTHADFYADLFPYFDAQNFLARDKELSTFQSHALRVGASYEFARSGWKWIDKGTLNFYYDRMQFSYDDFRNSTVSAPAADQPLYSFGANVFQFFVSVWF